MSIENQTDATATIDQTLIALALKWRAVMAKARRDRSMLEDADMLAFSCLILAAEWGEHLTESVNPVLEENEKLIQHLVEQWIENDLAGRVNPYRLEVSIRLILGTWLFSKNSVRSILVKNPRVP